MKCIVLGDSHIGSLRAAISKYGLPPNVAEVSFYAGPSSTMADLIIRDGKLVPTSEKLSRMLSYTSGGHKYIDFTSADIIIIHGLSLSISVCRRILEKNTIDVGKPRGLSYITSSCLSQAIADNLQSRLAIKLLQMVRQLTDKPVFMSQTPFPDVHIRALKDKRWEFLELESKSVLHAAFRAGCEIISKEYGVKHIPQPESTIVHHVYTYSKYSKNSQGIVGQEHDDSDLGHMNQEYGSLVWKNVVDSL